MRECGKVNEYGTVQMRGEDKVVLDAICEEVGKTRVRLLREAVEMLREKYSFLGEVKNGGRCGLQKSDRED